MIDLFTNLDPFRQYLVVLLLIMSIFELAAVANRKRMIVSFGLFPRRYLTVLRISISSLIHGNITHFTSNAMGLILLAFIMPAFSNFEYLLLAGWLGPTSVVWIIGRKGFHVGASGLIFTLVGASLLSMLYEPTFKNGIVTLFCLLVFVPGGFRSNTKGAKTISIEAHASGLIIGILFVYQDKFNGLANLSF